MKDQQVADLLCKYLVKNGRLRAEEAPEVLTRNLFQSQILDSFGFIDLIATVEKEFEVSLDLSCFEEEGNQTIQGLASLIAREMA